MKPVTDLYDRHPGADIYVVGTGASMRVFPTSLLEGRISIGLNMAWKVAPVMYGITIGPHLNVPEFMDGEEPHPEITWITKREKSRKVLSPEQFEHAEQHFYQFEIQQGKNSQTGDWVSDSGRAVDFVRRPTGTMLYQWSSISQTAANLAANMGAKNVILVGCDNCALGDNHHAHVQHTKWLGGAPDDRYMQYYEGLDEVRAALRERGVNLLTMSPFLKLDAPDMDFVRLCEQLEHPTFLASSGDISETDHPSRLWTAPSPPTAASPTTLLGRARAIARRVLRAG